MFVPRNPSRRPMPGRQSRIPIMTSNARASPKGPDYYLSEDSTSYGSHSPYPPSVSSSDSETDSKLNPSFSTSHHLHASIASAPDYRLREIMAKLVDRSPGFQHAVAKELLSPDPPSASPLRRKPRRSLRPGSSDTIIPERKCTRCGKYVKYGKDHSYFRPERCAFHPGKNAWLALGGLPEANLLCYRSP